MIADMHYTILDREAQPGDGNTYEFEAIQHRDTAASFISVDIPPEVVRGYISNQFNRQWLEG